MPKCAFKRVTKHFYWNHTSTWVFSCKRAACFQNTSFWKHLWRTASDLMWDECCTLLLQLKKIGSLLSYCWLSYFIKVKWCHFFFISISSLQLLWLAIVCLSLQTMKKEIPIIRETCKTSRAWITWGDDYQQICVVVQWYLQKFFLWFYYLSDVSTISLLLKFIVVCKT